MLSNLLHHMAKFKIFVFLIVFQVSFHSSICQRCELLNTPGITIPEGKIIVQYGEPLEIYCKLHEEYMKNHANITSANIEFTKNTDTLPSEWVTQVNQSVAKLYVENPVPSHSMYTCKLNTAKYQNNVCSNEVIVGTKPTRVQNFSCISYNYEYLMCSWIEPEHYVKTVYNLTYYFQGRSSRTIFSPRNITRVGNKASVYWDLSTKPQYRFTQQIYNFLMDISNIFGNLTQKITFFHFANVKPAPVDRLKVLHKTSDSVTLSWSTKHPMTLFPPSVIHRVLYQSELDKEDEWHVADTTSINKQSIPVFNLTGLKYANTLYNIRVSIISSKARLTDEKMWSENVTISVRTESTIPDAPPRTNIGSFQTVNKKSGRDVYLYWQSVPDQMKNGQNFFYKVCQIEDEIIMYPEVMNSYIKIDDLEYSKKYRFIIFSKNDRGQSENNLEIVIPASNEQLKEPSLFTVGLFEEKVYNLSWTPPSNSNITVKNYTIFYCRFNNNRSYKCKENLEWIVVPSHVTSTNVTVPDDKIYQFAISANSETSSSGMVWASSVCIYF